MTTRGNDKVEEAAEAVAGGHKHAAEGDAHLRDQQPPKRRTRRGGDGVGGGGGRSNRKNGNNNNSSNEPTNHFGGTASSGGEPPTKQQRRRNNRNNNRNNRSRTDGPSTQQPMETEGTNDEGQQSKKRGNNNNQRRNNNSSSNNNYYNNRNNRNSNRKVQKEDEAKSDDVEMPDAYLYKGKQQSKEGIGPPEDRERESELSMKPAAANSKNSNNRGRRNNRNRNKKSDDQNNDVEGTKAEEGDVDGGNDAADVASEEARAKEEHRQEVFAEQDFSSLDLSSPTREAVDGFGFTSMTRIQALAIPAGLQGRDVLIQAKTGHGKTLAFGIPLFEHLHRQQEQRRQGLVVAPTRELALQTKQVFDKLARCHRNLRLACFIGGTNMGSDSKWLQRNKGVDVLIATPGRLLDHLQTVPDLLDRLDYLVLDEADRLLDEGFQRDMEKIFRLIPSDRRTLLASATFPKNMQRFQRLVNLKEDYVKVSAISEGDGDDGDGNDVAVNRRLEERVCTVTAENWLPVLYGMLLEDLDAGYKTILFLQAAQQTRFVAFLLNHTPHGKRIYEIHSRLSQAQRVRQLDGFKGRQGGAILCSSDVGARGWDIDGVDAVVQLGVPSDNDTYVHRVGRTARAGATGRATCLVYDWEESLFFDRFPRARALRQPGLVDRALDRLRRSDGAFASGGDTVRAMVENSAANKDFPRVSQQGYQALLGYQNSFKGKMRLTSEQVVGLMNDWIAACGCPVPPALQKKTVGKMNLRGTKGLRVQGVAGVPVEG